MWNKVFIEQWFVLPLCSALLFILSFHPFNVWPLAFVAFFPLGYFIAGFPKRPLREVFWGGFITGSLFALALAYFTVMQFRWISGVYLFVDLVHLSFIPIALLGGVVCGCSVLGYRLLMTRSLLLNSLLGAGMYVAGEMLLATIFGGYYFAMLGYAATPITFLISFAGIGGAFFVSFLVAWCSACLVQLVVAPKGKLKWFFIEVMGICVLLTAVFFVQKHELEPTGAPLRTLSIATIQTGDSSRVGFGAIKNGAFTSPELERRLRMAAVTNPNLLVYPFSPVEGDLWQGTPTAFNKQILIAPQTAFNAWLKPIVPSTTTVMVWTNLYLGSKFYTEFQYIQDGNLVDEYRKRNIFPFIDYTPLWSQRLGFYSTQVDETAGNRVQPLNLDGVPVAGLLCSEVQQQQLARSEASRASLFVSAGSEAVFVDDIASEFSLKATQFRAAENNMPAVRANILGPSAIVSRDGSFVAYVPRGADNIMRGTVTLYPPHPTLYSRFGNSLMVLFLCILFFIASIVRFRSPHA